MSKLFLEDQEWYPVYTLYTSDPDKDRTKIELTPEEITRAILAFAEFDAVQDILIAAIREGKCKHS